MCACTCRMYASGALWMFPLSIPRHKRRAMCTTPSVPHPVFPSPLYPAALPPSRAFPHPSLSTALEIHLVRPRLASSHSLFLFLLSPLSQSLFPPRHPRSQCNERYTLSSSSSSCSRRRCFYSAAQSVSARLPVRFVYREMRVRTYAGRTSVIHEPKRTWEEIRAFAR